MKIDILTLFPEMFNGPFDTSMLKKAKDIGAVEIDIHNLRKWTTDKRKTVDGRSYGGGKGMVIRVDIVHKALKNLKTEKLKNNAGNPQKSKIILLSPQGKVFNQKKAVELANLDAITLIAGHYEGFDERIAENLVDEELSIGDYVLTGGEIPAMVIVDSVVRLLPGVLEEEATSHESFSSGPEVLQTGSPAMNSHLPSAILDFPQYTHPEKFLKWSVPKVLLSGNHKEIERYRLEMALAKTKKNRPDLLKLKKPNLPLGPGEKE